jgi:hypothetical protein
LVGLVVVVKLVGRPGHRSLAQALLVYQLEAWRQGLGCAAGPAARLANPEVDGERARLFTPARRLCFAPPRAGAG